MPPIYEFVCQDCGIESDRLMPYAERKTPKHPCSECGGSVAWAGLSAPKVGTEQFFGAILQNGARVRGGLHAVPKRPGKKQ